MRILIIDGNEEAIKIIKKNLEAECFTVDEAFDGDQGSFLARTNGYDIILVNSRLTVKSEEEVIKEIRNDGNLTPIIFLSSSTKTEDKIKFLNLGADDYIIKPFSYAELLARVKTVTRRPLTEKKSFYELDDLTLDAKKHEVMRSNQDVYLTRKEFLLLEFLLRNQGCCVSRGLILESVWDVNADPFSNTIESHILNLRKKLDANGKNKLIHTVPGVGYKMALVERKFERKKKIINSKSEIRNPKS